MKEYRHSGPELEANAFAAEILMPKAMIDPKITSREPTWEIIQKLSTDFSVSLITAAIRYADLTKQPVMAVFSDGRNVRWWRESRTKMDGLWLESQQPLAEDSVAFHRVVDAGVKPESIQVPWGAWFPHCQSYGDEELFELAESVDDKGTIMSLLWAPAR